MIKKDFKKIKKEHYEICSQIIKNNGSCDEINCGKCPFYHENTNVNNCRHFWNDEITKEKAEEFIKIFKSKRFNFNNFLSKIIGR